MNQLDMFPPFGLQSATGGNYPASLNLARRKRDAGIKQVSANNREFLTVMRDFAKQICREKGWVCSDDLREWAHGHNLKPTHYNAFSVILTTKDFIPGEYIVSRQPQGHANRVRRWTLRATA